MKNKIISVATVLIALVVGYIVSNPLVFNICGNIYQFNNYNGCLDISIKNIGSPLFIFAMWILPIAVVATFLPNKIFHSLLKFALWAIPLAFIFVAITPVSSTAYMDFFQFYRDDAARLSGQVFSVISLIIIICKWYIEHRKLGHSVS